MFILFSRNSLSSYLRISAAMLVLVIVLNLFFWGAQSIAINLVPTPWDKFLHGLTFFILACGIGLASGLHGSRMMIVSIAGALMVGALDEWRQIYLPGRHPGWDDLMADAVGSLAGAALLLLRKRSPGEHN